MVNNSSPQLDRVFSALSDATRRSIMERLSTGSLTVTELAAPYPCSLPAISKHLSVLEGAGLLTRTTHGRMRTCSIVPEAMDEATEWLDRYRRFWNDKLDSLERYLETDNKETL